VEANVLNGVDAEWLEPDEVKKLCPIVNISSDLRYPVLGATYQPRAGIAKHDYVAWGFARRADAAGVDLLQGCEVTGFVTDGDRVTGVRTTLGDIAAGQVAMCAAGHTSVLTDMLGFRSRCKAIRCRRWCPSCSSPCTRRS
jgi:sarcosine oxidase subunit beta